MPVLTAIDVLGVQDFVFASNRLKDSIGASWIVRWATTNDGALRGLVPNTGSVLLQAGGNAIVDFHSTDAMNDAKSFASHYTRRLFDEAPGLQVAICHRGYQSGELARALLALKVDIARSKFERRPSTPVLGLSVTASCRSTGLPACKLDPQDATTPLSLSLARLRQPVIQEKAHKRWTEYLANNDFEFPNKLDDMGRSYGDTSLIGVVHIDGNGVGKAIDSWLHSCSEQSLSDDQLRKEYGEWSKALDKAVGDTFQAIVRRTQKAVEIKIDEQVQREAWINSRTKDLNFLLKEQSASEGGKLLLPLRPILMGGDDLTFVCDGRIALDLAETGLEAFRNTNIPFLGQMSACAGIAIVRAHAPFAASYAMAEKLCTSAKEALREKKALSDSALDWHIGTAKPNEPVVSIRSRQYSQSGCRLTCRPYRLGTDHCETGTWRWLSRILLDDNKLGLRSGVWKEHRNKVKSLELIAREGPGAVSGALHSWQVAEKALSFPDAINKTGACGFLDQKTTPLIDAVELLDLYLPLGEAIGQTADQDGNS